MNRKPEPSSRLKGIIWDIAATAGVENLTALQRDLDFRLERLRQNKGEDFFESTPDIRTLQRIIELDINSLVPEVVIAKLPRHVWHLRKDYEDIKQLAESDKAEQKALKEAEIEQKTYQEARHEQKIRELAGSLQREIGLPHILEIFLSPRLNAVALSIDQEEDDLYQGLRSHLKSGGFSDVLKNIQAWKAGARQYLSNCNDLLKNVRGKIPSDEVIVSPDGEPKPGLIIDDFCGTVCADVVGRATGSPTRLGYKTERHYLHPDLWVLKYGARGIYLGLKTEEIEKYKKMHEDLIVEYAPYPATSNMTTLSERLSEIDTKISRQLQKFSLMERLPGHCELC